MYILCHSTNFIYIVKSMTEVNIHVINHVMCEGNKGKYR